MQINGIKVSEKIRDRLHDSLSFRLPRNIHFYRNYCISVTTVFQTSGTPEYGWPLLGPLKPNRIIAPIGRLLSQTPQPGHVHRCLCLCEVFPAHSMGFTTSDLLLRSLCNYHSRSYRLLRPHFIKILSKCFLKY